jgi:hypothetical protein
MLGPKIVTTSGRLNFPNWTAQEAYQLSLKGSYPAADVASASPSFLVLLNQTQFERVVTHIKDVYLPYCTEQFKAGAKSDSLSPAEVAQLIAGLEGDLADQMYNTPLKPVHEKTQDLAPDAVATLKVIGSKGSTIAQKAIVRDESELLIPDPDILTYPTIKPIGETIHKMYRGCYVGATLNLYAYHNGKHPGFSAGASSAVFKLDGEPFSGAVDVDADAIFMD